MLRSLGRLCIIAASILAGYLLWVLWGTGLITARAQDDLRQEFAPKLENPRVPPAGEPVRIPGDAVAEIIIPRIELDAIVVNGTGTEDLKKGPGLYPGSALPWEPSGRVAIAGHRTTYGAPFWDLDRLKEGDLIQLATEYGTFDYRVVRTEIVQPSATQVLDQTERPTLVLTTCNPRFSAAQRLIVIADRE